MAERQIMLIGCGKMGSAMLEGWLGDASLDAQFTIIEPDQTHLGWVPVSHVFRSIKIVLLPSQIMCQPAR